MAKPKEEQSFEWVAPWLTASGQVWVHIGYGQYTLMLPTSFRAAAALERMRACDERSRAAQARSLRAYFVEKELETRDA